MQAIIILFFSLLRCMVQKHIFYMHVHAYIHTVNKAATLDCQSAAEVASRAILEFEREKEDARAGSCNVIITGLPPNPEINDGLLHG